MKVALRNILERSTGPTGSVLFHIVALFLIFKFLVIEKQQQHQSEIEVMIMEPETIELEEIEELEELEEVEIEEVEIPEDTETPPDVENPEENVDTTDLDMMNIDSPLTLKGLWEGRGSNRSRMAAEYAGKWAPRVLGSVDKALQWLKRNQRGDGSWKYNGDDRRIGIAGLGLLAFLAHGETLSSEKYGKTIDKAINFLISKQKPNGAICLFTENKFTLHCPYEHAIATYALAEAYGMTRLPELKPVMDKAVKLIIDKQQVGGGWDYYYRSYAESKRRDTSLNGWHVQALKAAEIAGSKVPGIKESMEKAVKDLKDYFNGATSMFWYESKTKDTERTLSDERLLNNTAIAVLALQLTGHGEDDEVKRGLNALKSASCNWYNKVRISWLYGWYYITQAKFHGNSNWEKWNNQFANTLTSNQQPDGHWDGSRIDNPDKHYSNEHRYGPAYNTILAALTLQVYYRNLPTYKSTAVEVTAKPIDESYEDDFIIDF